MNYSILVSQDFASKILYTQWLT